MGSLDKGGLTVSVAAPRDDERGVASVLGVEGYTVPCVKEGFFS